MPDYPILLRIDGSHPSIRRSITDLAPQIQAIAPLTGGAAISTGGAATTHDPTVLAARNAPIVTASDMDMTRVRLVILIPVAYCSGIIVHVPMAGLFGVVAASASQPLLDQAIEAAKFLSGASNPYLAGYTRDAYAHAIFAVPVLRIPHKILTNSSELSAARAAGTRTAWCLAHALGEEPMYEYTLRAVNRLRAMKEPVADSGLRIGTWQRAVPTTPHRADAIWQRKEQKESTKTEWADFIAKEEARGAEIRAALVAADNGDGALVLWAENVRTAADLISDLLPPPQGIPDFTLDTLRLVEFPRPPPPIGTEWLHSVPPQCVPQGLGEVTWAEVHTQWAREMISAALNRTAARGFETFGGDEPVTPVPRHVIIGPGGFMLRQHADGVGDYCMNIVVLQLDEQKGTLSPMDFQATYAEHRNIDMITAAIKRVLGDGATDYELLCFLAEGVRFKAYVPPDQRLMHNLISLDSRGPQAAVTALGLIKQGRVACMKLGKRDELITPGGKCPLHFTPGEATGSGGADKKGDPSKARMVQNYTAPNGSIDKPVRVRNHPNDADGAHVLDQNAASGDKTKGPRQASSSRPSRVRPPSPAPKLGIICGAPNNKPWDPVFTSIQRRGDNSDAATPFKPRGQPTLEARHQSVAAMTRWYLEPHLTAEEVVDDYPELQVDRDYRSYHGHTLVAAVRRFARAALTGADLTFWSGCLDDGCHRFVLAEWVLQLATDGLYSRVPHPFPDPEIKMRPRHTYRALAVLSHMAHLANTFLAGGTDDVSGMFWQFWRHVSEYHLGMFYMILPFEEIIMVDGVATKIKVLYFCALYWKVMLMGGRPASKIACRWSEPWLAVWRQRMAPIVKEWIPKQTPELQALVAERRIALGEEQAQPFWADYFTDDFQFHYVGPELMAAGTLVWHELNSEALVEMCEIHKKGAGTIIDAIGARNVLNGGFGVLTQSKRLRVISDCQLALAGSLTRERFESNNGMIVHADDIMNLAPGSLHGIWRPLKLPGFKEDLVVLTGNAKARYAEIIQQMTSRAGASFLCAVDDAVISDGQHPEAPKLHITSDACTDAERPGIFGSAQGLFYLFEMDAVWLSRHINVLEAVGRGLDGIVIAPAHPGIEIVNECDNDNAAVSGLHRARVEDMQAVQRALDESASYQATAMRSWEEQIQGIANDLNDAGSRGKWDVLYAVSASIGLRMRRLYLAHYPEAIAFLERVLATTTDRGCSHPNPPSFRCAGCSATISAIQRALTLTEHCRGLCTACVPNGGAPRALYGGEDDEVIRFMLRNSPEEVDEDSPAISRGARVATAAPGPQLFGSAGSSRGRAPSGQGILRQPWEARHTRSAMSSPTSPVLFSAPPQAPPEPAPTILPCESPPILLAAPTYPCLPPRARFGTHEQQPMAHRATRHGKRPMPASATAARALAMQELEDYLLADTSEYSIGGGDPAKVHEMITDSLSLITDGIPAGTLKADNSGVGWAVRFCIDADTAFLRPLVLTHADHPRERYLFARCVVFHAMNAAPRSKARIGDNGKVITTVKPESSLAPVLAWRRILRDSGHELIDLKTIRPHLKGLVERFKTNWGQMSLVPIRELPFALPQLHAVNNTLSTAVGSFDALRWPATKRHALRTAFTYGLATGVRANEPTRAFLADSDFTRRSHFVLIGGGDNELPMTAATLLSVTDGTLLRGRRGPSKCDRSGMEWGDRDCWFKLDRTNPLNFAAAWLAYELEHPCPPEERHVWAAFSPDGGKLPWTTSGLQRDFNELMRCAVGDAEAARRSWHSLRVTIATALSTRRHPDGLIQALVCWKTLDAMRLYAKTNRHQYADAVEEVTTTSIDVTRVNHIPAHGPEYVIDELDAALEALDGHDGDKGGAKGGASKTTEGPAAAARPTLPQATKPARSAAAPAAKSKRKAKQPAATAETTASQTITLTDGTSVQISFDITVGSKVRVPNSFWAWGAGHTWSDIMGRCNEPFQFADGSTAAAYVIHAAPRRDAIKASSMRYLPQRDAEGAAMRKRARG